MKNKVLIESLRVDREGKIKEILQKEWNISSRLYRRLSQEKAISLNGREIFTNASVKEGDRISVQLGYEENTYPSYPMDIDVVYEDDYLLIVNKDRGVVVHPTKGTKEATLLHGISHRMKQRGEEYKIRFGNRIDRDTSGIVIIAKNKYAHHQISEELEKRGVYKEYFAFVEGCFKDKRKVRENIKAVEGEARRVVHSLGQECLTFFEPIWTSDKFSFIRAIPYTGRTHQIRVHLSHIGHPIVGDELYGSTCSHPLMLHAYGMRLLHPFTKKVLWIQAPLKEDMKRMIKLTEVKNEK